MIIQKDPTKLDPNFPFQIRKQILKRQDNTENSFHWHSFCEITCVERGNGKYFVNGQTWPVRAGDIIIFNNVELHGWWVEDPEMEVTVMIFSPEFAGSPSSFFDDSYLQPFIERGTNFRNVIHAGETYASEIVSILHDINWESKKKETGYRQMIRAQVLRLLTLLIRHYQNDGEKDRDNRQLSQKKKQMQRLEAAFYYINAHYTEKITLQDAAAAACLSPNYFSTCFRKAMGFGFEEYLTEMRLKKAEEMKKTTSLSVMEIAGRCGFGNMSNYYRLKKKYSSTSNQ
ncbi:MAG: helix-turn-helix domain-containing protein [Bilifractor sp.]